MPKRVVDGEAIWNSKKLKKVEPPAYRAEYTNMIPLATANGSFECDPEMIWSRIYAYNRPDISAETVAKILDEFERVKLLFRWTDEQENRFGYWVGIEKPGRLPGQSRQGSHERVATNRIPTESIRKFTDSNGIHDETVKIDNTPTTTPAMDSENFQTEANGNEKLLGFGSGFGLGTGSGSGGASVPLEDYIAKARNLGFRDSQSITVEHAFSEEVMERKADPAEMVIALSRIFRWTKNGKYAPRLQEVIRRWREPQELWERGGEETKVEAAPAKKDPEAERKRLEALERKLVEEGNARRAAGKRQVADA